MNTPAPDALARLEQARPTVAAQIKADAKLATERAIALAAMLSYEGFYWEPIPEIEQITKLAPFNNEQEMAAYLLKRDGRVLCDFFGRGCLKAATHIERMHKDSFYKRTCCTVCRNAQIQRTYERRMRKQRDPNEGRYTVTAEDARMFDKMARQKVVPAPKGTGD